MNGQFRLLSPASIGSVAIKNRVMVSSMCLYFSGKNGEVTDKMITFFENRARSGIGAFIIPANPHGENKRARGSLAGDDRIAQWKPLMDAIHRHGARAFCQIHPSSVQYGRSDFSADADSPFELSTEAIRKLIESYAIGARRAKLAGFDGVEIHGAHGHEVAMLLSQSLNTRTDCYGGSLENCARTVTEMIAQMKELCGAEFPVVLRISGEERIPGGRELPESLEICKLARGAGADAIHVSSGMPESEEWECPPSEIEQGHLAWMGKYLKEALDIPVIVVGRIVDWEVGERMIENGEADFIAMARTVLAEPRWAESIGVEKFIGRKCIGCNQGCRTRREQTKSLAACLQNPMLGKEELIQFQRDEKPKKPKKICVIGGGVAGLEAANVFSQRGHRVTVFEREDRVGGMFRRASMAPGKRTYLNVVEYYEKLLPERGVEIVLNSRQDGIPDGEWDLVVVAVGGEPIRPPIQVKDARVRLAVDVLDSGNLSAEDYVVVGDGLVGCEMADYILEKGHRAVLVGNDPRDPLTTQGVARWHFMKNRFENAGLETIRHSTVRSIDGTGFVAVAEDGSERRVEGCYDYILACGFKPAREDVLRRFQKEGLPVMVVGNARTAGDAMDAIHDAFGQAVEYVFQ